MKKIFLLLIAVVACHCAYSQTFNPTSMINTAGSADNFTGGYTFAYTPSGSPWYGAFMSFGGFTNTYDCQISTDYTLGKHISFRTRNGDAHTWNPWFEIWHSGNLNRADADFTARTIRTSNVYNNGNLWSKQITVALTNPWPDYVFHPNYHLPSLTEVKNYINENHHLSDMPSAQDVAKDGINLGEMNKLLTQKVEELTLYLIEQNKQIAEQKRLAEAQQKQINGLIEKLSTLTKN
jgi:hypothetical protein